MSPKPESPDAFLDELTAGLLPEAAAQALANLVNRAAAKLHTLSRAQAAAHKNEPAWPAWAQLQNASRALVLQASTSRDLAARLPPPPPAEGLSAEGSAAEGSAAAGSSAAAGPSAEGSAAAGSSAAEGFSADASPPP